MRRRRSGLNFGKQRKKFNVPLFKEIMLWILEVVLVVAFAYICVTNFGMRTSVVGQAMEDQLYAGDAILVNRSAYMIGKPDAGDVIVFLPNGNEKSHYYVRRVIAGPGDTVQIKNGAVYVNDIMYKETVDVVAIEEPGMAAEAIKLGQGEYFVLGDNRNNSEDSRFANIGMVKKEYIIGQAWFKLGSLRQMGVIH